MTTQSRFADLDHISVLGITARGFHGVLPHERRDGQTFRVDVVLGVDIGEAARSDDLARTVDYSAVAADVVARLQGEPRNLIETLAEEIATDCLGRVGVQAVKVTVHKPEAPVGVAFADVTVSIVRQR